MTTDTDRLAQCEHLLLYLNSQTWTRGDRSEAFAEIVRRAMDLGVHLLLAHEMPGAGVTAVTLARRGGAHSAAADGHVRAPPRPLGARQGGLTRLPAMEEQGCEDERHGCDFSTFFSCAAGATPNDLLKRGIYSEIAIALQSGPWREASMATLGMVFALSKEQAQAQAAGHDVLIQGLDGAPESTWCGLSTIRSLCGGKKRERFKVQASARMSADGNVCASAMSASAAEPSWEQSAFAARPSTAEAQHRATRLVSSTTVTESTGAAAATSAMEVAAQYRQLQPELVFSSAELDEDIEVIEAHLAL